MVMIFSKFSVKFNAEICECQMSVEMGECPRLSTNERHLFSARAVIRHAIC